MPSRSLISGLHLFVLSAALAAGSSFAAPPITPSTASPAVSAGRWDGLEASWSRLRETLALEHPDGLPLAQSIAPSLLRSIARIEPALRARELSPHRAAAGLAAVVLDAARLGGADPEELSSLEVRLREVLPPILQALLPPDPALAAVDRQAAWPSRSSAGVPEAVALDLRGDLSPSAGPVPR